MESVSDLLGLVAARGEKMGLTYAGALTPLEAAVVLRLVPSARLIDIRTRAELDWVGRIPGAVEIEWNTYPGGQPNPHFLTQLRREVDPEVLLLFICRSGARSHNAAMAAAQAGLGNSYNVLEGFEGDKDASGQRGKVGGWRFAELPWFQS